MTKITIRARSSALQALTVRSVASEFRLDAPGAIGGIEAELAAKGDVTIMNKLILIALVTPLVAQPALAAKKQQPQQPQAYVEDVSDSSGSYFNGLRVPHQAAPSNSRPFCTGGFQQCNYDSIGNHQDVNVR
jgi:hypothetical protein